MYMFLTSPSRLMGVTWLSMALPCLLAPATVMQLSFKPALLQSETCNEHKESTSKLGRFLMQCFGSQAMLVGTLLLTTDMNKTAYKIFGAAILPFFVFDVVAYKAGYITLMGAIGDGIGNVIFTVCCAVGAGYL